MEHPRLDSLTNWLIMGTPDPQLSTLPKLWSTAKMIIYNGSETVGVSMVLVSLWGVIIDFGLLNVDFCQ